MLALWAAPLTPGTGFVGVAGGLLDAGVVAVCDLLRDEQGEKVSMGPPFGRGPGGVPRVQPPDRREVKALEQRVEVDVDGVHAATSAARTAATV